MISIRLKDVNLVGGIGVVGFALGAAAGYFYARHRLENVYRQIAEHEIEEAKAFYSILNKTGDYASPEKAAEALLAYQGEIDKVELEEELTEAIVEATDSVREQTKVVKRATKKLAAIPREEFDYDKEVQNRTDDRPYIITKAEFEQNEMDYEQETLTYYQGDDVLADPRDEVVEMVDGTVGIENLARFGHGSGDPSIVYTRHEGLALDCEIVLDKREFKKVVLGFIEHSEKKKPRKFRDDD
jgi:K+/H+ antiporter YhaU regulatory subunit KhtT